MVWMNVKMRPTPGDACTVKNVIEWVVSPVTISDFRKVRFYGGVLDSKTSLAGVLAVFGRPFFWKTRKNDRRLAGLLAVFSRPFSAPGGKSDFRVQIGRAFDRGFVIFLKKAIKKFWFFADRAFNSVWWRFFWLKSCKKVVIWQGTCGHSAMSCFS